MKYSSWTVSLATLALLSTCGLGLLIAQGAPPAPFKPPRGLHHMDVPVPADNPLTPGKIKLGEMLFFDRRLSRDRAMSCDTCHIPEKGWSDGVPTSPRFDKTMNTRHTPTLYGVGYYPELFWDGRVKGLEAAIQAVWKEQMGANPDVVANEIAQIAGYQTSFRAEFGGPPTPDRIVKALASFVRTIHAGDTPWDRHAQDEKSLEESRAGQGFRVFSQVARCTLCHLPPLYSDTLFHNIGVGSDRPNPDPGRGKALADAAARAGRRPPPQAADFEGAFKTPTIRGLLHSGPYFHDGSAATLEAAMDLMLKGGIPNPQLDERLRKWPVTPAQRELLLVFLKSLSPKPQRYPRPKLP